jgi:hypothetical protein
MASTKKAELEKQDRARDAAFNKAMHGNSAEAAGGIRAMLSKNNDAKQAAVDEYFKHWDDKAAKDETEETREVSEPNASAAATATTTHCEADILTSCGNRNERPSTPP